MITKIRKNELKKMYRTTQKVKEIHVELNSFYVYLKGWLLLFPQTKEQDILLFETITDLIEQQDVPIHLSVDVENMFTVQSIKERLVQQHFELAQLLSAMDECGLSSLPSWNPDYWFVNSVVNLFNDIEQVLIANNLEINYL